jgi:hypothetical protein
MTLSKFVLRLKTFPNTKFSIIFVFSPVTPETSSIKKLELEVKIAAAANVKTHVNLITLANMTVKQARLLYYLEKMRVIDHMLTRQNAIDTLVCNMLNVTLKLSQFDLKLTWNISGRVWDRARSKQISSCCWRSF